MPVVRLARLKGLSLGINGVMRDFSAGEDYVLTPEEFSAVVDRTDQIGQLYFVDVTPEVVQEETPQIQEEDPADILGEVAEAPEPPAPVEPPKPKKDTRKGK